MYKTGIWQLVSASRLQNPNTRDVTSYQLLKQVGKNAEYQPEAEEIFESIVRFLRLPSGIFRSTYRQRFAGLDPMVNTILQEVFPQGALEVHDWAASDCLVSAEWAESLWPAFPSARVTASDTLLNLMEVSRGSQAYVLEPDGTPLQFIRPPFVVSLQKPIPSYYPVNRLLAARARRLLRQAQQALRLHQQKQPHTPWEVEEISLIHPLARRLAAQGPRFEIQQHSVFKPLDSPCHAIRTMNIFNRGYFDELTLKTGAASVFDSLIEGGIWVVGRTTEETRPPRNSVSVFQKSGSAFKLLKRINGGSEIEDLVLNQPAGSAISEARA